MREKMTKKQNEAIQQAVATRKILAQAAYRELYAEGTVFGWNTLYEKFNTEIGDANTNLIFITKAVVRELVSQEKISLIAETDYNSIYELPGTDCILVRCRANRFFVTDRDKTETIMKHRVIAHDKGRKNVYGEYGRRERLRLTVDGKVWNLEDVIAGTGALGEKQGNEVHHSSKTWNLTERELLKVTPEEHHKIHKELGTNGFSDKITLLTYEEAVLVIQEIIEYVNS